MSIASRTVTEKPGPESEEDRLESELFADGVLDQIPSPMAGTAAYRPWQPIPWEGKSVSETILDERR